MVACQLLKYCHFVEDTEGHAMELRFLRDTDKREVDFVVLRDRQPIFAVECKTGGRDVKPTRAEAVVAPEDLAYRHGQKRIGKQKRQNSKAKYLTDPISQLLLGPWQGPFPATGSIS
jgi:hypothetical protein